MRMMMMMMWERPNPHGESMSDGRKDGKGRREKDDAGGLDSCLLSRDQVFPGSLGYFLEGDLYIL